VTRTSEIETAILEVGGFIGYDGPHIQP
jgi:hypothetical protein